MKQWLVRFVVLLVFNVLVLLVIGWLTPANVGWSAVWAGIVLSFLTMWVRPLLTRWFSGGAERSSMQRTKTGQGIVRVGIVLLIAFIVWIVTVWLSGVTVGLNPLAYVLPPVILAIGWWIYDLIAQRAEHHAGALYDKATGVQIEGADADIPAIPSPETRAARAELQDGLTAEQRRMLDELGNS
jgi:hypothetical protein